MLKVREAAHLVALLTLLALPAAPASTQPMPVAKAENVGGLRAFRSDEELRDLLRRVRAAENERARSRPPLPPAAPSPAPITAPGITNTQEQGVDEGGIVKQRGDILVILRRGRLFTVSVRGGGLRAIDWIDAYPPGAQSPGDWYDEMLISGDMVTIVGYSDSRGGTEINRFLMDRSGRLSFVDAHHLRSDDYYARSNYASRLIGTRLVIYAPLRLRWRADPLESLPATRPWTGSAADGDFRPIATAREIYAPPNALAGNLEGLVLHSLVTCDIAARDFGCSAIGVLGPPSREFYVSAGAAYLWIGGTNQEWTGWMSRDLAPPRTRYDFSFIFRLPISGERPTAIAARGRPIDQFSFREDATEGMLNVLIRAGTGRAGMWEPEAPHGTMALMRVPLSEFDDGQSEVRRRFYRLLPMVPASAGRLSNRFVGDHVIYGYDAPQGASGGVAVAVPVGGGDVADLPLSHGLTRIEPLGRDALAVGAGADHSLGFTAIELTGGPRLGSTHRIPGAREGESRSHAFFFRPDPGSPDGASGILGLPIARPASEQYRRLFRSTAAMLFLRRESSQFSPAGELAADQHGAVNDDCRASCWDWYGNARPIFLDRRILALLGYELVEGRLGAQGMREIGRLNFAPVQWRK